MPRCSRLRSGLLILGLSVVPLLGIACSPNAPEVPDGADAALVQGRGIFQANCVQCHGSSGGGGRGPQLNDAAVIDKYPDIADQIAVVTDGKGGMPAFGGNLAPDEIEAVVRYTREVLNTLR